MASDKEERPPIWFWIVAGAAALWNAIGVAGFVAEIAMTEEGLARLHEAQRALVAATPAWVTAAYGAAVLGGLAGSIALLLRSRWAMPLLSFSLVAILVQMGQAIFFSQMVELLGPSSIVMPLVIIAVAIGLIALAHLSARRGWLAGNGKVRTA